MDTTPFGEFPVANVSEALATIAPDGGLTARNFAMSTLLQQLGSSGTAARSLAEFPLRPEDRARLIAGERVCLDVDALRFDLWIAKCTTTVWLLASEPVTMSSRMGLELAIARSRTLGSLAGAIVHDLANLLGSGLGLAEALRPGLTDPGELQTLDELVQGTRQGAMLGRVLARLLGRAPRQRAVVGLHDLVLEVMALVGKHSVHRGLDLRVQPTGRPAAVRVVAEDALQALLHGFLFCLAGSVVDSAVRSLVVEVGTDQSPIAGGRPRDLAFARFTVAPFDAIAARGAGDLLERGDTMLRTANRLGESGRNLLHAALVMAGSGGELKGRAADGSFVLEFRWPRVQRGAGGDP